MYRIEFLLSIDVRDSRNDRLRDDSGEQGLNDDFVHLGPKAQTDSNHTHFEREVKMEVYGRHIDTILRCSDTARPAEPYIFGMQPADMLQSQSVDALFSAENVGSEKGVTLSDPQVMDRKTPGFLVVYLYFPRI